MRASRNREIVAEIYMLFRERCDEVRRYVEFMEVVADRKVTGLAVDRKSRKKAIQDYDLDRELVKTLRANGFLLLYNLVEATMTNAIDAIHRSVEGDGLEFDRLSRDFQKVALNHFRKATANGCYNAVFQKNGHPIQLAMVRLGYNKEGIFSGNVDCSEIKKAAERYGFKSPDPNRNGRQIAKKLQDVKDKRNALAHGRLSFEQCGESTAPEYLERTAHETMVYLRAVLWAVSRYLRERRYALRIEAAGSEV